MLQHFPKPWPQPGWLCPWGQPSYEGIQWDFCSQWDLHSIPRAKLGFSKQQNTPFGWSRIFLLFLPPRCFFFHKGLMIPALEAVSAQLCSFFFFFLQPLSALRQAQSAA